MRREVEKIEKLQKKIKDAEKALYDIDKKNNWVRYIGKGFCDEATDAECIEFNELTNKIIYCCR